MSNDQQITITLTFDTSNMNQVERPGDHVFSEIPLSQGNTFVTLNGMEYNLNAYRAKSGRYYYKLSAYVPKHLRNTTFNKVNEQVETPIELDTIAM